MGGVDGQEHRQAERGDAQWIGHGCFLWRDLVAAILTPFHLFSPQHQALLSLLIVSATAQDRRADRRSISPFDRHTHLEAI
jgi:hypothetical protein